MKKKWNCIPPPKLIEIKLHCLYLCRGQLKNDGQVFPLRSGQIALLLEPPLQFVYLSLYVTQL